MTVFASRLTGTEPPPFDWGAWNVDFDQRMASLKIALDRWHETERAMDQAHHDLTVDLRAILTERGK